MSTFVTLLALASYGTVAALLAALVAGVLHRWRLAATLSRAVVLAGGAIGLASVAALVLAPLAPHDPSMKAVVLSRGVSEFMNCAAIAVAAALLAAPLWAISRRRLRR
jgi:hypothetical protein